MVDGNNALHAIPELATELSRDRNQARESLLRLLEPLQSGGNVMLTVVFDGRGGRSSIAKHRNIEEFTAYKGSQDGLARLITEEEVFYQIWADGNMIEEIRFEHDFQETYRYTQDHALMAELTPESFKKPEN